MKLGKINQLIVLLVLMTMVLAACGENKSEADTSSLEAIETNDKPSEVSEAIVLDHAFGQTVIEEKPERIASIAWGNQDVPLALGVVPVGISMANYGVTDDSNLLPWTKAAYESLGVSDPTLFNDLSELDYEGMSTVSPDVILAAYSGITEEEYQVLSEIAPVAAYPERPWQTFWRDQIRIDSKAMGMAKEGEQLVEDLDTLIADKVSNYPAIEGKTAAFFWFDPSDLGQFYVYLPADPRSAYLTDLGMTFPQSILDIAEDSDSFYVSLSAEKSDLLTDVDIIVTYGDETLLSAMQSDTLIGQIPAVQNGAVAVIKDGTPLAASCTPSALSIPATLDDFLSLINGAAINVAE